MNTADRTMIITAAVNITLMREDKLRETMCALLASHPTIVARALGIESDTVSKKGTFNVVVTDISKQAHNRIVAIKVFREAVGAGLADAKAWTEGHDVTPSYTRIPSGAFGTDLPYADAEALLNRVKDISIKSNCNWVVEIKPSSKPIKPFVYTSHLHGQSWTI